MKRAIALLFAVLMIMTQIIMVSPASEEAGGASAFSENIETQEKGTSSPTIVKQNTKKVMTAIIPPSLMKYLFVPDLDHLTVGNPNPMKGDFFTSQWGNMTSDEDVRELLHAYNLIRWDGENGMFVHDPSVVSGFVATEDAAGDHTYTLVLYDDLYYSDGTQINAWDYAFSILLQIALAGESFGTSGSGKEYLYGYQDYVDGTTPYLAGVRVTADDTLAITISADYLPFFYEMALLSCNPYPISVIAPGVEVRDDGNGVYLANIDDTVEEPIFTDELLQETVMDENTGYRSHPSVVSGPYVLTSWDGEIAEFEINPYYKGNAEGQVPVVQTITFQCVDNDSMIDKFEAGEYDLLNKVTNSNTISKGMALIASDTEGDTYGMSNYPRSGLSYILFDCSKAAMAEKEVRQAIAWCMDRDLITKEYTGNFGATVHSYYGVGQWLYGVVNGTIQPPVEDPDENDPASVAEYEEAMEAYEEMSLDDLVDYEADAETAISFLESAGWTLNEDGIREKEIDGEKVTLEFTLLYPEGSAVAEYIEEGSIPVFEEAGIRVTLESASAADLMTQVYYPEYRTADMIFLASNFEVDFDPSTLFITETDEETGEEIHIWAASGLQDEELYTTTVEMHRTEPGDVLTYMQHWLEFVYKFNDVLPMIPLYSNVYVDFYTAYLRNYQISENTSWSGAIVGSYMSDEPIEEETIDEEEEDGLTEEEKAAGIVEFGD